MRSKVKYIAYVLFWTDVKESGTWPHVLHGLPTEALDLVEDYIGLYL